MNDALARQIRAKMNLSPSEIHLNNAGVCPATRPAVEAVSAFFEKHSREGFGIVPHLIERYESSRSTIARLIGAEPDSVAHFSSCSSAISAVAFGFPLKRGDEILTWDQEYPSNAYPWYAAAKRAGASVKTVASDATYGVDTARMAEAIGPRTRIVAISWAQSRTGAMTDLPLLAEACRKHDTWLVVDIIQAAGVVEFDMKAQGVDAVCCGTQKWLAGPMGHGFLAIRPERVEQLIPVPQGAITYGMPYDPVDPNKAPRSDARRYEPGTPMILGAVGAEASIEVLLSAGIKAINEHANSLAARLIEGIEESGGTVLSRSGKPGDSPIVTFKPRGELARVSASLKAESITHSEREDTLRLSPHGFNTSDEIERTIAVIRGN